MKIAKATKTIKPNTILKDSDGYFLIQNYNSNLGWYNWVDCDRHGKIKTPYINGCSTPTELIGAEIIAEG